MTLQKLLLKGDQQWKCKALNSKVIKAHARTEMALRIKTSSSILMKLMWKIWRTLKAKVLHHKGLRVRIKRKISSSFSKRNS
jgi:hypothetical protein